VFLVPLLGGVRGGLIQRIAIVFNKKKASHIILILRILPENQEGI